MPTPTSESEIVVIATDLLRTVLLERWYSGGIGLLRSILRFRVAAWGCDSGLRLGYCFRVMSANLHEAFLRLQSVLWTYLRSSEEAQAVLDARRKLLLC